MWINATIEDLKGLYLFKDLDKKEIEKIAEFTKLKSYSPKDIIYYENDIKKQLFYLKSGHVKVYKVDRFDNEIFLYDIKSDNMITKISSLLDDTINCFGNIECLSPCEVLIIDYDKFKDLCLTNPKLLIKIVDIFAKRNQMLECVINRELVYDGVAKVAFTLVNDFELFNRLKKQDIAYRLNIQPETLSRILKKLIKRGLIKSEQGIVEIIDKDGLKEIYE